MRMPNTPRRPARPLCAAVCLALLLISGLSSAALSIRSAHAGNGDWTSGGPPDAITAIALHPTNHQELLAAGRASLWRTRDGGASWTSIADAALAGTLAYDPLSPATVYGASADRKRVMKSTDGGATWSAIFSGDNSTQIHDVLPDPSTPGLLLVAGTAADGLAQLWRSTDAGATWRPTLAPNQRGAGGIGPTAITTLAAQPGTLSTPATSTAPAIPATPGHLFAGLQVYHGGAVLKSVDGGATWTTAYSGNLTPLTAPIALTVSRRTPESATIYASFTVSGAGSVIRSDDGGATWLKVTGTPTSAAQWTAVALTTNPLQPDWVYAAVSASIPSSGPPSQTTGLFASNDRGQTWHRAGGDVPPVAGHAGLAFAIPSRTLFTGGITEPNHGVQQLTIAWPAAPRFTQHYDRYDGLRLLGNGISLETQVGAYASQYFEKGRLEDHAGESPDPNWQLMYGLLVDELHGARSPLPVGGDVSTLTYAGLNDLASPSHRIPPPADYSGSGSHPLQDGGTFVPFTVDLAGAPGHAVPIYFWDYVNRPDLFPGGWLHDIGLPIAPAQKVRVTKYLPEGPAERTISIQAFQRTILTRDPLNPPDWQVERANAGTDYRKHFPDRVGP
jgi:hypothetical protein